MKRGRLKLFYISCLVVSLGLALSFPFFFNKKAVKGVTKGQKSYHTLAVPSDPLYSTQWNYKKINAENAWDQTTGDPTVKIAVLDTGILLNHEDFAGKLVPGYDFVGNDADPNPDPGGGAAVYHGTLVAGLVAAGTNNGLGIGSSCWSCKIMPIRVLDNNGDGTSDVIAEGIRYAVDNGAKVINMSFGYSHSYGEDSYLSDAVNYAFSHGVIMVAASGNDGEGVNYPAVYDQVIAVGATDQSDLVASWSSFGPELDVVAPGVSVRTTYTYWNGSSYVGNVYANASGTSIASPQVAGLAGLLISRTPSLSVNQVISRARIWADKVSGMGGANYTNNYGYGRTNYFSSLNSNLSILSPQNGLSTTATAQNISGATEPLATVTVYLDSVQKGITNADATGSWSYSLNGLSLGSHYIEAEVSISGTTYRTGVTVTVSQYTTFNVYRFWNNNGTHFYTASEAEKNNVIAKWPGTYKFEGVAYSLIQGGGNSVSLYRFYNMKNNTHFYTASEAEKNNILAKWPTTYHLDGVAYNVSGSGGTPVYRFWNSNGTHFYTASEAEKNNVIAKWPGTFKFEGIGYYIYN